VAWFSSSKQLPANKHGYFPPEGATARGWRCSDEIQCNDQGQPAPRKWPARCPTCGGAAEPWLDEPWEEESKGWRLRTLISEGDEYGHSTNSLFSWQFGQALRWSDTAKARSVVAEALAWHKTFRGPYGYEQSDPRAMMFFHAMDYDEIALAAELLATELADMDYQTVDFTPIDDSNQSAMRVKYIGFVDRATQLLALPESRALPQVAVIDRAARYIGSATQHAMGALPVKYQWQRLMQTPAMSG
jgi:hypothetical protein